MTSNGPRSQYPYGADALSPRPLYDFPSPTSNYPSGVGVSPGLYPMAYQNTPRFASSAFIPPPDIFAEAQGGQAVRQAPSGRDSRSRRSGVLNDDPVAMHLLVETAMSDSQFFEILSIDEVEALKQEQRGLDGKLNTLRKKLESEAKIRDATRSLARLAGKTDKGHQRGLGSRGSNLLKAPSTRSEEELSMSNKKVDDLARELLEIEARMRLIDMQLLMHTAGVLQLTHNGPTKRGQSAQLSNGGGQRPDSPASIYNYESRRSARAIADDNFDERSLYRSPENLDSLMNALQNGTHLHSESTAGLSQASSAAAKRLEDLNERLRDLIVAVNPEQNEEYALPPQVSAVNPPDISAMEQQLDFLDQGLRDIGAEHANIRAGSNSSDDTGARLEGINTQLYAMLSKSTDKALPPPPAAETGRQEQLNYLEESYYDIQQLHYSMTEQIDQLRAQSDSETRELQEYRSKAPNDQSAQYEATLVGLWDIIQTGEEEARQRKRQRREILTANPDADEELSPDEDYDPSEQFSLSAFSTKVQWLYSRASSLKEKQSILLRQVKQQRQLNSRSDAQKEEQFAQLKEQVSSARFEKESMSKELERAMEQLNTFDQQKSGFDSATLQEAERRIDTLEAQLRDAQDEARVEAATTQAELAQSSARIDEAMAELREATTAKEAAEARSTEATNALAAKEEELRDLESEVVRLTTEVTLAKAELDGAYGTRAERAAESAANPAIKKELEELSAKNAGLLTQVEILKKAQDAASQSEAEARGTEKNLKQELAAMASEYEALTRDSIQNEKDRDMLEASIDKLRDEREALEMELSDERVKWLGMRSPSVSNGAATSMESTSIRMLREDFRKMMRDRTAEGLKALRNEQEERRKLEGLVRQLRKDASPQKSNLSRSMTAL